jgi:N-acetylmuramoyl-L-alanine amidase
MQPQPRAFFAAIACLSLALAAAADAAVVVVDAGHGGADHGAHANGVREKDVALAIAREIGRALEARAIQVVHTRTDDAFVPLAERTSIANRAEADLFLSVHANSSPSPHANGPETYFVSLDASDAEARRVAMLENNVFEQADAVGDSSDVVGAILGDLIRTDHLRASSELAAGLQRRLAGLGARGRGVKQAPFVVLMGVNMPAALLEIGFLTNARDARRVSAPAQQRRIARAVAKAVDAWLASQGRGSAE